ncbi:MAG: NfeD family protein, partial [Acidimicrobiia bacterium]
MGAALVWFLVAVGFAAGEVAVAGSFFLLPFAVGAAAGGATALFGGGLALQIVIAAVVSAIAAALLIPYGRRLGQSTGSTGVGANRWVGKEAVVLSEIPGRGEVGRIRVDREEWMAESLTGAPIRPGSTV